MILRLWPILLLMVKTQVIQLHTLFRHGARELNYPEYSLTHLNTLGELTAVGLRQEYNLGAYLRKKYLPNQKYDPSQVRVRATDYNRTLQSAMAVLQGLFPLGTGPQVPNIDDSLLLPPGANIGDVLKGEVYALPQGMTVVPVHTVQKDKDYLLKAYSQHTCPVNPSIWQQYMQSPLYQQYPKDVEQAIQWVQNTYHFKFNSSQDIGTELDKVIDNYYSDKFKGNKWELKEDSEVFRQLTYSRMFSDLYVLWHDHRQISIYTSKLLENIVTSMESAMAGQTVPWLHLYSSHGSNVISLMRAFNMTSWQCHYDHFHNISSQHQYCYGFPPYAAHFQIELIKEQQGYAVRVLYNGDTIQVCPGQDLCSFSQFKDLQKRFYLADFDDQCQGKAASVYLAMMPSGEHLVLVIMVVLALGVVVKLGMVLRKIDNESPGFQLQINS